MLAALLLAMMLVAACSPTGTVQPPTPTPTNSQSARLAEARVAIAALTRAIEADDQPAFLALVSDRDPTFTDRARLLFNNLSTLPLTELDLLVEPDDRPLSPSRQALLGADAWTQPVAVTWQLTGDDGPAQHRVWFTWVAEGGRAELAGTFDGPTPTVPEQQPIWWLGPVTARVSGSTTVVAGAGQPLDRWTKLVGRAAADAQRRLPTPVAADWDGRVVVEIPAAARDFESVLGQPPGRYAAIAAVTQPTGNAARPATRVVVNPRASRLVNENQLAELLRHEIVHVATRSPQSPAPSWAVEGLAEWVALDRDPGSRSPGVIAVLTDVRRNGPPAQLPGDADFAVGAARLNRAYAEAWLVCEYIVATHSAADLGRLYAGLDAGKTVDQASRSVLGRSERSLTAGWRRYLVDQAAAG